MKRQLPTQTRVKSSFTPIQTGLLQRKCASCEKRSILPGSCAECQKGRSPLQRRAAHSNEVNEVPAIVHQVLNSSGQPLDAETQSFMESRFKHDFSQVRIHTDVKAAQSAQAVDALAYTAKKNIVFGAGQYAPTTNEGRQLLSHELAHVVQQSQFDGSRSGPLAIESNSTAEREADVVAAQIVEKPNATGLGQALPIGAESVENQLVRSSVSSQRLMRQSRPETCTTRYRPARTFRQLIDLVRAAETQLSACGFSTADDRIHVLRGIYYGTTWSTDYAVEASPVRNLGFQTYTASTTPADPRSCLNCGLFEALQGSQDITDGGRSIDFGHLIIGMDARRSRIARSVPIPSQGATGLAISTWVGDLGGGAAMLSLARVSDPTRRAVQYFRGSDYGGSINLEGDVAGYLVAPDSATPNAPSAPQMPASGMIADALEAYLIPSGTTHNWNSRCQDFLQMMGGVVTSGSLTNRATVISSLAGQIEGFACWYLVNRLRQTGRLSTTTLENASNHISGASHEIAEVFVDALEYCMSNPGSAIQARGSGPAPSPAGSSSGFCWATIQSLRAAERAQQIGQDLEQGARDIWRDLRQRF